MFLVWLVVVTAVVAAVVLFTLGRGEGLVDSPADDVEVDLPDDREVSPADLSAVRLPMALRGYRMSAVDDVLDRLAAELAVRDARIRDLESGPGTAR